MGIDYRILVVDDEESLRDIMTQVLSEAGYEVTALESGEKALEAFQKNPYPLVITDIRMQGMSGIQLIQEIKQLQPDTQVIIMTSHASLDTAIMAIQSGAYDYLMKPFEDLQLISAVVQRAVEKAILIEEKRRLMETLKKNNEQLEHVNRILKELAIRDGLTGLYNHRYFQEALTMELARSRRHERTFSLIFMDVDFFKKYNDTHGHLQGDQLLATLGKILKDRLRFTDIVARYGGEEFVALLPETSKGNARRLAENLRQCVADHPFPGAEVQPLGRVTVSMGVAAFPEDGTDSPTLIQCADQALYQAKRNGRNTVC